MDELNQIKKLAGITNEFKGQKEYSQENISHTAQALKDKEKKLGLKPGDQDWFKLWFSRPYWTGQPSFRGRKK